MLAFSKSFSLPSLPAYPLVSVLMASYNYASYLSRALESLLGQTYPHFEVLVCDDGSTDDSRDIAAQYAQRDSRIRLLTQPNGGVASALNTAYSESRGALVCLLDADDFFAPKKLARVVACFQNRPAAGLVLHAMQVVDAREHLMHQIPAVSTIEDGWIAEKVVARGGRWRSMPTSALAFHRGLADQLFPIPEATFRSEADGFLSALAPLLAEVAFLPEPLAGYRLHGANLTSTSLLNANVVARHLSSLARTTHAVNTRLGDMGLSARRISLSHHINWHEHRFMQALFDNRSRIETWQLFLSLSKALLADDLYSPLRKSLGLFAGLGGVLLPHRHRAIWLTNVLHGRDLRRWLQWLAGKV